VRRDHRWTASTGKAEAQNIAGSPVRIVFVVAPPQFFVSHRLSLALRARALGYDVAVLTPEGEGVDAIKAQGLSWYPIPFDPGGMNPLRDFRTFSELLRRFKDLRPDIVHNVTLKPVLYGTLAARLSGVPRVVNAVSGLGYLFTGNRRVKRLLGITLYRLFMRHPDMRVILQNQDDVSFFVGQRLASREVIRVIRGSGVDVDEYRPRLHGEGPPVVMQTSRIVADKGVREFIAAARQVKETWPKARFLLVGPMYPGNPSAIAEEELNAAQAAGAVEWLGYRSDIATLLGEATIFCLASYREGLPKSLLEAAACGLPLVTTDTSGCREVVTDGENGLLVPVADSHSLARAIVRLIADPALAKRLGQRARERVEREFSLDLVIDQHIAIYAESGLRQRGIGC
jgi:glycosyltransferase involved in cell wall biosynthesis